MLNPFSRDKAGMHEYLKTKSPMCILTIIAFDIPVVRNSMSIYIFSPLINGPGIKHIQLLKNQPYCLRK